MKKSDAIEALRRCADPETIPGKARFFRSGTGEYGEGDTFIGITVPQTRRIVQQFWKELTISECEEILSEGCHEERLFALLVLVRKFEKGSNEEKSAICSAYLRCRSFVNNWDLVDSSAFQIVGAYELCFPTDILTELAHSDSLWDRRIAVIASFAHIKAERYDIPLKIIEILLTDGEDLIHKASGWMLREIGNRSLETERSFLERWSSTMPRTMLRYAIEKLAPQERRFWMTKP